MPTYQTVQRILETEKGPVSVLVCGSPFAVGKYKRVTSGPYALTYHSDYRGLCLSRVEKDGRPQSLYMCEKDLAGMHYILVGETLREIKRTIYEFYQEMGIDA